MPKLALTHTNTWRLLEFAESHRLNLANTLHPHTLPRTATWHAPNGQVHNQVDFILTSQRFKSPINKANTRSFPDADIGSDHDNLLTTIKLKLKTKRFKKSPRIRFDLEKLKDPNIAEVSQAKVGGKKCAALCVHDSGVNTPAKESLKCFDCSGEVLTIEYIMNVICTVFSISYSSRQSTLAHKAWYLKNYINYTVINVMKSALSGTFKY